jgi:DNA primase
LPFFLNQHTAVRELVFCLDNDPPRREAAATMARKYAEKGYTAWIELPKGKDFNDDLQALRTQIQAE